MKKLLTIFMIILVIFVLVSCDYPEKSFNALSENDIPKEVTRDFKLPKAVYAPFIWTTNSDAIVIDDQIAVVNQKDEDVIVTLTATINKTSRSFEILVFKAGSDRSWREKAEDALIELNDLYTEIDENHLELPKTIDDLYIKYNPNNSLGEYGFYENEQNAYISSGFQAKDENVGLSVAFYKDEDINNSDNYIYTGYLELFAHKLKTDDIYIQTLNEINIHNYQKNFKFNFNVKLNDYIEFSDHDDYDIELEFDGDKISQINNTKIQVIEKTEGNSYIKGYLIITIDNMPKKILITIYCK